VRLGSGCRAGSVGRVGGRGRRRLSNRFWLAFCHFPFAFHIPVASLRNQNLPIFRRNNCSLFQSSSRARRTATLSGFFDFSQGLAVNNGVRA
jgi:hypothetical protein